MQFKAMIGDHKKEEIREAADIVEIISDHVKLRRAGSNFIGLCPFHNEKTPSFSVSPSLGIFKCFGCGEGGDVFNFIMKTDGVGFEEAVRTLADRYQIAVPEKGDDRYDPRDHLKDGIYHALRFAGTFYYQTLAESEEAEPVRQYLKKRGYPWKTIKKYGLGYAPDRFDALLDAADQAGINKEYLEESGLIKSRENDSGYYDTFRGRLMFPVFNPGGKVIAFGGRTLSSSKSVPKYINSPQTPVYNKSEVLYGIQVAKNEIRKAEEAILVEGYTDVISMHQEGFLNVVSTSGTSLTPGQIAVIRRYGNLILMVFDADAAGVKAAVRGITIALEGGAGVRVLTLPEGEDPDSFIRELRFEGFLAYKKKNTLNFLEYLVSQAKKEGFWKDPVDREKIITRILEVIAVIPNELSRMNYIQELSSISKIGDRSLLQALDLARARHLKKNRRTQSGAGRLRHSPASSPKSETEEDTTSSKDSENKDRREKAYQKRCPMYEKELVRLMLAFNAKIIEFIGNYCNADYFENEEMKKFYEDIMVRFQDGAPVSVEAYSRREHPYPELLGEIFLERYSISEYNAKKRGGRIHRDADPVKTARGALKSIKIRFLERTREFFLNQYQEAGLKDKPRLQECIKKITKEQNRYRTETLNELFPDL